jgi:hypothetical protein
MARMDALPRQASSPIDPDLALLDLLLQQPHMLVHNLRKLGMKGMS